MPQAALEEMQMPLFLQTQNNTGSCWVVINQVREAFFSCLCVLHRVTLPSRTAVVHGP